MRIVLFFLTAILLTLQIGSTTAQEPAPLDEIDDFLQAQFEANGFPGMSAAVIRDGDVVYTEGFGEGITPETPFYAGSLAKSVTAVAILTLVDTGEIALDDPITAYLPEFTVTGGSADAITVRMLLNHRSGLSDASYADLRTDELRSLEAAVADLSGAALSSDPGTEFAYFNQNYVLLGRVVEIASGQDFEDYVQATIFDPLGMTSATYTPPEGIPQGYNFLYGQPIARGNIVPLYSPSGGLIVTAEDMAKFIAIFLNDGKPILSAESAALAITPPGEHTPYGMGWYEGQLGDAEALVHGGVLSNFHADMAILPDADAGVILLYNSNNLFGVMLSYSGILGGVVTRLTPVEALNNVISLQTIGIVLLVLSVLAVLNDLRQLFQLPEWARKNHERSLPLVMLDIVLTPIALYILIFLPNIVLLLSGRAVDHNLLIAYLPDVMLLLAIGSVLSTLRAVGKLLLLARRDGASAAAPA